MSDVPAVQDYKTELEALPYIQQLYVQQYLLDLNPRAVRDRLRIQQADWERIRRCRRTEDCIHCQVEHVIQLAIHQRNYRVQYTAYDVLRVLVEEINTLRNADIADLYDGDGKLLPVTKWPEEFQRGLVEGIEQEDLYERSHDGEHGENRAGWDKSGTVTKIKLASRKKLLLQALELAGRHTGVGAFPVAGERLGQGMSDLAGAIDQAISEGRQRAARRLKE